MKPPPRGYPHPAGAPHGYPQPQPGRPPHPSGMQLPSIAPHGRFPPPRMMPMGMGIPMRPASHGMVPMQRAAMAPMTPAQRAAQQQQQVQKQKQLRAKSQRQMHQQQQHAMMSQAMSMEAVGHNDLNIIAPPTGAPTAVVAPPPLMGMPAQLTDTDMFADSLIPEQYGQDIIRRELLDKLLAELGHAGYMLDESTVACLQQMCAEYLDRVVSKAIDYSMQRGGYGDGDVHHVDMTDFRRAVAKFAPYGVGVRVPLGVKAMAPSPRKLSARERQRRGLDGRDGEEEVITGGVFAPHKLALSSHRRRLALVEKVRGQQDKEDKLQRLKEEQTVKRKLKESRKRKRNQLSG